MPLKITALAATAVIALGTASGAAKADTDFNTICQASGPDRAELTRNAKAFFVGGPLSQVKGAFGEAWNVMGPITFDTYYDPAGNIHPNNGKLIHLAAYQDCVSAGNTTQFFVIFEAEGDKVADVSVEISYQDADFAARGEALNWRRYNSDPALISAVRAVLGESADKAEVHETLAAAGMVAPVGCDAVGEDMALYVSPAFPSDSLAHKLGTNASHEDRLTVAARFDAQGEMVELVPATGLCQIG